MPSTASTPATVASSSINTSIGGLRATEVVCGSSGRIGATVTIDRAPNQLHTAPAAATTASTISTVARRFCRITRPAS
jgi:hypothetical protein